MFPVDSKILIIDDSNFSRTVLKGALRDLRFWKIMEATSGAAAKAMLLEDEQAKQPVHLIICDIHMPEMSGLDLLRWIRTQEHSKNLPVIILTTAHEKEMIVEAGKLGISHYMIKPFDVSTLKDRMVSAWQRHGARWYNELQKNG